MKTIADFARARFGARHFTVAASWLTVGYGLVLTGFLIVRLVLGDRTPTLFALNALSLYAFAPLPLVLVTGVALRRPAPLILSALGALSWCSIWGELFVPRSSAGAHERSVVVLSYNALGYNQNPASTLDVIRDSGADVVALQELNLETGRLIERELAALYPYRWLEPRAGVSGGGILSKHPFTRAGSPLLAGRWVSEPMVVTLDVSGKELTFVRFHAFAGPAHVHDRERQARALAAFARSQRGPLIMAGDLNATDQNHAYELIANELQDSWRGAGFGFGHTFPGDPTREEGGSRPSILGLSAPLWLIRIDYIFHSDELEATSARLGLYPGPGGSDHRGVIARLTL